MGWPEGGERMQIDESQVGEALVLSPHGRLDAQSAPAFQDSVLARIDAGTLQLLLDLDALEYVSSAGLRAVLMIAKRLRQNGGKLVVCSLRDNVAEVFRVSGFDAVIDTAADRAAGLAALA
jgi:stage II sporulation protein AA (anti-sigma F factor antagonist)